MKSYDGTIVIGTSVDTSGLKQGINNLDSSIKKSTSSLQNTVSKTFNMLKHTIIGAGIVLAIRQIGKEMDSAVGRLDTMKNFNNVMSNLGISSKDAEASIKRLSEKLKGLPTSLDSAALSVQRFASANNNVKASTEMYLALNNAILAGGASTELQASAMEQLSQAYAKGKPDMMEWRTAMMTMPAQMQQVAKVMGYINAEELGEALRKGKVSMNEFMFTLMKMNKEGLNGFKSLEEQARNSTGGIKTSIENVKNAITRGLANIMDAIGRSNIAGFFDGIRNAIDKVIPYIQAFVKLIMTAIAYISALFGKKIKKQADETSSSIDGLGTSLSNTTDELDDATESAGNLKKELKQLTAFDEMNVLQNNKTKSGSGSGGTGASDLSNLSGFDFDVDFDDTSSKLDEIYNKLLKFAKWFTEDMDFQPLVNSIKKLSGALDNLKSGIGDWLYVFIRDFVKPLSTYVINDFLPRFINDTADAISKIDFEKINEAFSNFWKVLEPFNESVGEGLLWFYEEVLLPLGEWAINDALPVFLNALAGALEVVNKAWQDLEPYWQKFWDEFLQPLAEWTGGVIVDTINGIAEGLDKISKNKTLMKFIELLVGGLFLNSIMIIISPLIVLKALFDGIKIAIDTVKTSFERLKEAIQPVGDKIKEVFSPMTEFFKNIFDTIFGHVKTVVEDIKIIAKFLWDKIKEIFKPVGDWFKQKFNEAKEGIKKVFEPIINFFGELWNKIKSKFINVGEKTGEAVGGAFQNVINKVIGAVENILNAPIRAINGLIGSLKKIPGLGGLSKLSTFNLPRLATGGIINQPGRGVPIGGAIGGEAGREGVLPLTDERAMAMLGKEIGKWITINANIPVSVGNRQLGRVVKQIMAEDDFAMNN